MVTPVGGWIWYLWAVAMASAVLALVQYSSEYYAIFIHWELRNYGSERAP